MLSEDPLIGAELSLGIPRVCAALSSRFRENPACAPKPLPMFLMSASSRFPGPQAVPDTVAIAKQRCLAVRTSRHGYFPDMRTLGGRPADTTQRAVARISKAGATQASFLSR